MSRYLGRIRKKSNLQVWPAGRFQSKKNEISESGGRPGGGGWGRRLAGATGPGNFTIVEGANSGVDGKQS